MEKSYVVQRPNSVTNKSDFFRVTEFHSWQKYVNGDAWTYEYTNYGTHEAAQRACDTLNNV